MTPERDDLTVVEQRIRAAKEYIYKQERLIERLADAGCDPLRHGTPRTGYRDGQG